MTLFKKKAVNPPASSDDLEAVMKKYDKESNTRVWEGTPKIVVTCILAAFSVFCLYVTLFASWLEEIRLTSFVAFIVFLGYLVFPAKKGHQKVNYIPWYDLIPVMSYLLLRGKCRYCHASISRQYPLVELLFALISGLLAWRYGISKAFFVYALFSGIFLVLSVIQCDSK